MTRSDERWKLAEAVEKLERVLRDAKSSPIGFDTSMLIANLESMKDRMAVIEHEVQISQEEKKQLGERQLAMAYLARRETALSQVEREQYGAFLEQEFFTRNDFGSLSTFYENTWDRLSEDGKAQMSHRIWEGVRQEQYEFSELPKAVKKEEAQRLYDLLIMQPLPSQLSHIPERERRAFLSEWKNGNQSESYEVLDRPGFAENVAISSKPVVSASAEVVSKSQALKTAQTEIASPKQFNLGIDDSLGELELSLNDLKLVESGSSAIEPVPLAATATQSGEPVVKR